MSRQEAMDMTAAPKEDREMVIDFLKASGATCVERTGNNILCKAPVKAVNKMLMTSMQAFKHKSTGAVVHLVDGDHTFPEALKGTCQHCHPFLPRQLKRSHREAQISIPAS